MSQYKSVFIGLSGSARIGKTTMLNYLTDNYDVCNTDPGAAMKCAYSAINYPLDNCWLEKLGASFLDTGYEGIKEILRSSKDILLDEYEKSKSSSFRNEVIGFAELFRVVYPDMWAALAKELFYVPGKVAVGEIINDSEQLCISRHYDTVITVRLECRNPAEVVKADSRSPVAYYDFRYDYLLQDSLHVADALVEDYNYHYFNFGNHPEIKR